MDLLPLASLPERRKDVAPATPTPDSELSPHILLVEDHAGLARMMRLTLELKGYRVDIAASQHEARAQLAAQSFDMLVCDLGLPDGSGLELMALRPPGLPRRAIAFSGNGSPEDIERSIAAGFLEHLTKPVDPEQLIGAIERVAKLV